MTNGRVSLFDDFEHQVVLAKYVGGLPEDPEALSQYVYSLGALDGRRAGWVESALTVTATTLAFLFLWRWSRGSRVRSA